MLVSRDLEAMEQFEEQRPNPCSLLGGAKEQGTACLCPAMQHAMSLPARRGRTAYRTFRSTRPEFMAPLA